jgi:hypothetical protein
MLGGIALLAVATVAAPHGTLRLYGQAEIKSDSITLGAVADLSNLPRELQSRAAALQLFPAPAPRQERTIAHREIVSRARSLLPALRPWLPSKVDGAVRINLATARAAMPWAHCDEGTAKDRAVTLVVDAGWYRIERAATALQDTKPNARFFARTADGDAVQAYCRGEE